MIGEAFEYMAKHPVEGVLCEFGVWQGSGLESMAECALLYFGYLPPMWGFDTFTGMPETKVDLHDNCKEVWRPGGYADTGFAFVQERVPLAHLVQGYFCDLRPLRDLGIERVRFARIDCDLYEGYRDALRLLTPVIQPGTVLLFDEGVAPNDPAYHDGVRDSGERAIREWKEETGRKLKVLHNEWTESLTVLE